MVKHVITHCLPAVATTKARVELINHPLRDQGPRGKCQDGARGG